MGLDALQLILGCETAFGIEISEEKAIKIRTSKMAIDLIAAKVGASNHNAEVCPVMRSYYCIRQAFQVVVGLQRQEIQLDSKLRKLLPRSQRQELWNQIHSHIGVSKFPSFSFGVGSIFSPITVQNLVDWLLIRYPERFVEVDERWTRFQVRSIVRAVVRDASGVIDFQDDDDFFGELFC